MEQTEEEEQHEDLSPELEESHRFVDEVKATYKPHYDRLFASYTTAIGKALSKKEREMTGMTEQRLIYGEITFEALAYCIGRIKKEYGSLYCTLQAQGGTFYDLGTGTGKAIFAAGLLHDFEKIYGVEVLDGLFTASKEVLKDWNELTEMTFPTKAQIEFHVLQGDFLDTKVCNWIDGDVIFMNSTCFDDDTMNKLGKIACQLKPGAFVITITKQVHAPSGYFEMLESIDQRMSWGTATIYIQRRTEMENSRY